MKAKGQITSCWETTFSVHSTGCSESELPIENCRKYVAVELNRCAFDPMLVNPKCVWEAVDFFNHWKFGYNFQLFVYNFPKNLHTTSQTHFGFINIGSKVHRFSYTAIYFWPFSIGTPCRFVKNTNKVSSYSFLNQSVLLWQISAV